MPDVDPTLPRPAPARWPTADWLDGLADFWSEYEARYDEIATATLPEVMAHPTFGPMYAAMPDAARKAQATESRQRLGAAVGGDWGPYEAHLRAQGAAFAGMGIPFREWYDIVRIFERFLVPCLVERYLATPTRLSRAIVAMRQFLDAGMVVLAEAYLDAKDAIVRESERRLAVTLDSIGDAVIATDTAGRVTRMNPAAVHLTGWPAAEAIGRPLTEVFDIRSELTGEVAEAPVERVLREGIVIGLANHTELRARDGSVRPIADSAAPIRGDDGAVRGVVMVFRDQTGEREAEEARLHAARLEGENLRIEEATRLKSEFLASMSHELRTPLNSIIGFTQLVQDGDVGPVNARQVEFMGHVLSSGRHLLKLINDVLDLAKVEAGKMDFEPERIDVRVVCADVAASFHAECTRRALRLGVEAPADLPEALLDPRRLRQVLFNYISNAVKFSPRGAAIVVRASVDPGRRLRLEVEDHGPGIAAEDLGRLFVEFQQLDTEDRDARSGTGLGLALTRRIVEAQGGSVGVDSTPGQGSVFRAILPLDGKTAEPPGAAQKPALATEGPTATAVLLVYEDQGECATLVTALEAAGYHVDVAASGPEAVDLTGTRRYDAVAIEVALAGGSGLDVLRAIRANAHDGRVPVVVLAAADGEALAGWVVDDILPKPVEPSALLDVLRRLAVQRGAPVLVVEDDDASRALMANALEQLGYRAVCAPDAEQGLVAAERERPLSVILDLLLPGMDGFAFLERFRLLPDAQDVPVLVWTVKDLSARERRHLLGAARAVIPKEGGSAPIVTALRSVVPAPEPAGRRGRS
jgi:PAS domain S-box-containing protein